MEALRKKKELFEPMVRNRTLAGGGKPKEKGADTSKEAVRAPCIQKQVAEPPFWLITGKHSKGRRVRLGDKPAATPSFQRGCPVERTAPLRFPGAVLAEAIPTEKDADRDFSGRRREGG